jgi:hypothetical protein
MRQNAQTWRRMTLSRRARQANALQVSGELANLLVLFYEDLSFLVADQQHRGEETLDTGRLGPAAAALRQAITVDAPLLQRELEEEMKTARAEIKRIIGKQPKHASRTDLTTLLRVVRFAGATTCGTPAASLPELRRWGDTRRSRWPSRRGIREPRMTTPGRRHGEPGRVLRRPGRLRRCHSSAVSVPALQTGVVTPVTPVVTSFCTPTASGAAARS